MKALPVVAIAAAVVLIIIFAWYVLIYKPQQQAALDAAAKRAELEKLMQQGNAPVNTGGNTPANATPEEKLAAANRVSVGGGIEIWGDRIVFPKSNVHIRAVGNLLVVASNATGAPLVAFRQDGTVHTKGSVTQLPYKWGCGAPNTPVMTGDIITLPQLKWVP